MKLSSASTYALRAVARMAAGKANGIQASHDIAKANHIKLLIREHNGCPPYPVKITDATKGEDKTKVCTRQQQGDIPPPQMTVERFEQVQECRVRVPCLLKDQDDHPDRVLGG